MIHLQHGRERTGPFDEDALREAYLRGEVSADAMSWREGEHGWTRLGARWGECARRDRVGAILASCLAVVAVSGILLPLMAPALVDHTRLMIAVAAAAAVASVGLLALYAGRAIAAGRGRARAGLAAATLIALVAVAAPVLWVQSLVVAARHETDDATMELSPDGRVLHIEGSIGPAFVADFERALAGAPALARIDIDSGGGLLEEALMAADLIRDRRLRVRGVGECASACVLIWAASPTRELGRSAVIGLHQAWVDPALPELWQIEARAAHEPAMLDVLKNAGFSDALIERRDNAPPESMAWLHPAELLEEGVELQVVDADGVAIPADTIRTEDRRDPNEKDYGGY